MRTTVGQVLINQALPPELRDYNRELDKAGLLKLMTKLAQEHPEKYRDVTFQLQKLGASISTESNGNSFGPEHMRKSKTGLRYEQEIKNKLKEILANKQLKPADRNAQIIAALRAAQGTMQDEILKESLAEGNPLAQQVVSGARGNKMNLSSLRGSDLLYTDHRGNQIPLPVARSYSQGLSPIEYWAGTYGARKGVMDTKFATMDAGFLCLARGTLVRMGDFSIKKIEEIEVGDIVLGADKDGKTFPVKVTNTFNNGERELYRFRFRYGKARKRFIEIVATLKHQALTRHLRRNRVRPDPILRKTVTIKRVPLGECEHRSVSQHSLLPPQGFDDPQYGETHPWAWFVGLLTGDGGLTTNQLGYSCGDSGLLAVVTSRLSEHGFTVTPKKNSDYEYCIGDRGPGYPNRLRSFLRELGLLGKLAPEKFVPTVVSTWSNESVAAYIRGIFDTDGGVATSSNDSMPFLRLGMTAEAVVRGVEQLLAHRFGIYSQVCRGNTVGRPTGMFDSFANHDIHSLTIADRESVTRFAKLIGFDSPVKQTRLQSLLAESVTADREDQFLFHYLDRELIGNGPTHDIEVDHPDHLFVLANGAIVSNSKQLNQVSHRLLVTGDDYDEAQQKIMRGFPVDVGDPDNEGALLAHDIGGYKKNTPLTPKITKDIERQGIKRILVRSPAVGGSPEGGIYARDAGIRERGVLPGRGEQVGLTAAQSLSEPISQGQLSSKHSGGVAGASAATTGFDYINQLIQVPKTFKHGAVHSEQDGTVQRIEPAPAGGLNVTINDEIHYVPPHTNLKVKYGDVVEAGDTITDGAPNPAKIVQHKGIGEGRRYFVSAMLGAMRGSGMKAHRRNIEVLARGLINHVRLTDETDDNVPDDVIPYSTLEHTYKPREDAFTGDPIRAIGQYLESPVLHYTIGTKVRPSVLKELREFGVKEITTHKEPPPFESEMIRGMNSLRHDPDWMTRMYGSNLKDGLLDAVHHAGSSTDMGTSFVGGLAKSVDFGAKGLVRAPEPGKPAEMPKDNSDLLLPLPTLPPAKPSTMTLADPNAMPKPPESVKSKGMFSGLFKKSEDALFDPLTAVILMQKQAADLDPTGSSGPAGTTNPKPNMPGATGTPAAKEPATSSDDIKPQTAPISPIPKLPYGNKMPAPPAPPKVQHAPPPATATPPKPLAQTWRDNAGARAAFGSVRSPAFGTNEQGYSQSLFNPNALRTLLGGQRFSPPQPATPPSQVAAMPQDAAEPIDNTQHLAIPQVDVTNRSPNTEQQTQNTEQQTPNTEQQTPNTEQLDTEQLPVAGGVTDPLQGKADVRTFTGDLMSADRGFTDNLGTLPIYNAGLKAVGTGFNALKSLPAALSGANPAMAVPNVPAVPKAPGWLARTGGKIPKVLGPLGNLLMVGSEGAKFVGTSDEQALQRLEAKNQGKLKNDLPLLGYGQYLPSWAGGDFAKNHFTDIDTSTAGGQLLDNANNIGENVRGITATGRQAFNTMQDSYDQNERGLTHRVTVLRDTINKLRAKQQTGQLNPEETSRLDRLQKDLPNAIANRDSAQNPTLNPLDKDFSPGGFVTKMHRASTETPDYVPPVQVPGVTDKLRQQTSDEFAKSLLRQEPEPAKVDPMTQFVNPGKTPEQLNKERFEQEANEAIKKLLKSPNDPVPSKPTQWVDPNAPKPPSYWELESQKNVQPATNGLPLASGSIPIGSPTTQETPPVDPKNYRRIQW